MLTLNGVRTISGCSVYADDDDLLQRWYIPSSPRIAREANGRSSFGLILYRRDLSSIPEAERKTRAGGGLLTFTAELAVDDAVLADIRDELAGDPVLLDRVAARYADEEPWTAARLAAALKLDLVPVRDGNVTVGILGEAGAGEMVANLIGGGPASIVGSRRSAVTAKLTLDGAVLLENLVRAKRSGLFIRYQFNFRHRLNGVTMHVWCFARKAFSLLQEQWDRIQDNASWSESHSGGSSNYSFSHDESMNAGDIVHRVLTAAEYSGISLIPEGDLSEEAQTALIQMGTQQLKSFEAATFLQYQSGEGAEVDDMPELKTELATKDGKEYGHHGIQSYKLKSFTDSMEATLNFTMQTKQVVTSPLIVEGELADPLGGDNPDEHILVVDLTSADTRRIDMQVLCTSDFEKEPVDLVEVTLEYDGRSSAGITRQSYVFSPNDGLPKLFSAWWDRGDGAVRYSAIIHYKGSTAAYNWTGAKKGTLLVLDSDTLGILDVGVQAGLVDWERTTGVRVDLSYGNGHSATVMLSKSAQAGRWTEVVGESVLQPYSYVCTFQDRGNQRLEMPARRATARELVIDQMFENNLEVRVVPAGSFKAGGGVISQVLVALRYRDPAHAYEATDVATLGAQDASFVWKVPLVDPTLKRYSYQVKVIYVDGVVREDAWHETDSLVLPVGDPFGMKVEIQPLLLSLGVVKYNLATLRLSFNDSVHPDPQDKTFQITDFTKTLAWYFRFSDPNRRTYRSELTLFRATEVGIEETHLPPTDETRDVLVLKPPPPPPPR